MSMRVTSRLFIGLLGAGILFTLALISGLTWHFNHFQNVTSGAEKRSFAL